MDFDRRYGTIHLSNGLVVSPALTLSDFEVQPLFRASQLQYSGNPPWIHNRVSGDVTDGKMVFATVYFHLFSKNGSAASFQAPQLSQNLAILKLPVEWLFSWGRVISHHDSRSNTTSITVLYGDRLAETQASRKGGG